MVGKLRPKGIQPGWRIFQIRPGLARAWVHPPSLKAPFKGDSLNGVPSGRLLGKVMEVEHTRRFTSVKIRHPVWTNFVWVNVWTNLDAKGNSRGVMFCALRGPGDERPVGAESTETGTGVTEVDLSDDGADVPNEPSRGRGSEDPPNRDDSPGVEARGLGRNESEGSERLRIGAATQAPES